MKEIATIVGINLTVLVVYTIVSVFLHRLFDSEQVIIFSLGMCVFVLVHALACLVAMIVGFATERREMGIAFLVSMLLVLILGFLLLLALGSMMPEIHTK